MLEQKPHPLPFPSSSLPSEILLWLAQGVGPGTIFTSFLKNANIVIWLKLGYTESSRLTLKGKRRLTKRTVLGNGESEGMLVVTEPDDIIYLKSLRAPLDVSTLEITTCGFCEFSWFLFLSWWGEKLIFTLLQNKKNPNLGFASSIANFIGYCISC